MSVNALSGKQKGSFAYITIKDRLPVIITNVIDHLCRGKVDIGKLYGEGAAHELKEIISKLSKLKSDMQTNKPLTELIYCKDDNFVEWNDQIMNFITDFAEEPRWFTTTWLFAECYFYKKIIEIFHSSKFLTYFDPYEHLKCKAFEESRNNSISLLHLLGKSLRNPDLKKTEYQKNLISKMLKFSLWGNQCDLSISSGVVLSEDELNSSAKGDDHILSDDFEHLWSYITKLTDRQCELAFILDNAGFELVTDLCLAASFYELGIFKSITFYVKNIPWFVSDTTKKDLRWTLDRLSDDEFGEYGRKFTEYFDDGVWEVEEHTFWTHPSSFNEMLSQAPDLFKDLRRYSLIIFKGDLNYRKLVGDLDWPKETPLRTALRGFLPCPLLAVRTIKGGPVVGLDLKSNLVKEAFVKENWFRSGEFGVIQFVPISSIKKYITVIFWVAFIPIVSIFFKTMMDY